MAEEDGGRRSERFVSWAALLLSTVAAALALWAVAESRRSAQVSAFLDLSSRVAETEGRFLELAAADAEANGPLPPLGKAGARPKLTDAGLRSECLEAWQAYAYSLWSAELLDTRGAVPDGWVRQMWGTQLRVFDELNSADRSAAGSADLEPMACGPGQQMTEPFRLYWREWMHQEPPPPLPGTVRPLGPAAGR